MQGRDSVVRVYDFCDIVEVKFCVFKSGSPFCSGGNIISTFTCFYFFLVSDLNVPVPAYPRCLGIVLASKIIISVVPALHLDIDVAFPVVGVLVDVAVGAPLRGKPAAETGPRVRGRDEGRERAEGLASYYAHCTGRCANARPGLAWGRRTS